MGLLFIRKQESGYELESWHQLVSPLAVIGVAGQPRAGKYMLGISYVNLVLQTNVIVNLGTSHSFLELNESTVYFVNVD